MTEATTTLLAKRQHRPGRRWVLAAGLAGLAIIVAVAIWVLVRFVIPGHQSFSYRADLTAARQLRVDTSSVAFTLAPSPDAGVHIGAQGSYTDTAPTIRHTTVGDTTTIGAVCSASGVNQCSLEVRVLLPAQLAVIANTGDGQVAAHDLTGPLNITTSNGAIAADHTSGTLSLHTNNGSIDITGVHSTHVTAGTQNGAVNLAFAAPPTTVEANTSNGAVEIALPSTAAYYINTHTTNGGTQINLPSDRSAAHAISVTTSNGSIHIHPAGA